VVALRREVLGYVSQFLRVVPRVPTIDVVAEPLLHVGVEPNVAEARAAELLPFSILQVVEYKALSGKMMSPASRLQVTISC
ncbi:MAG: hypothetical protein AAFW82_11055, partial [Pseudomonadota bacterium]